MRRTTVFLFNGGVHSSVTAALTSPINYIDRTAITVNITAAALQRPHDKTERNMIAYGVPPLLDSWTSANFSAQHVIISHIVSVASHTTWGLPTNVSRRQSG